METVIYSATPLEAYRIEVAFLVVGWLVFVAALFVGVAKSLTRRWDARGVARQGRGPILAMVAAGIAAAATAGAAWVVQPVAREYRAGTRTIVFAPALKEARVHDHFRGGRSVSHLVSTDRRQRDGTTFLLDEEVYDRITYGRCYAFTFYGTGREEKVRHVTEVRIVPLSRCAEVPTPPGYLPPLPPGYFDVPPPPVRL